MLVLARVPDESVVIDDKIKVTVLSIRGNKVRLGIDADPSCRIYRRELWVEMQKEAGKPTEIPYLVAKALAQQAE